MKYFAKTDCPLKYNTFKALLKGLKFSMPIACQVFYDSVTLI